MCTQPSPTFSSTPVFGSTESEWRQVGVFEGGENEERVRTRKERENKGKYWSTGGEKEREQEERREYPGCR